jgi:hypothetical protein
MTSACRLIPVLAIAVCVTTDLPGAKATLMRTMDLAELTASAEQIVVGDVLAADSAWDSGHRSIYTTIVIGVRESWKGETPSDGRIRIRQLGGSVGEIEMTVHGMARFTSGERALLFLRQARVVGWSQGKRVVHWDTPGKRWLVDAPDRAGVVSVDSRGAPRAAESTQTESLDRLRERVRAMVRN